MELISQICATLILTGDYSVQRDLRELPSHDVDVKSNVEVVSVGHSTAFGTLQFVT